MTFLNDDELSRLRSEFSVLLPETVTIQRPVNTVNVYGDTVTVWVTRATTTGRLDPEGTRRTDFVVAVREEQRDYFTLTLAYDADIEAGDRVVISSIQYEVLTLHETHTKKAVIRCRVVEFTSDVESDAVLAATFTASYASAGTATPVATAGTEVLWYWGDGETSTGASPSHEYTTAGTKTILMYDADNVNALDMSSENLTAAEVDWSKITGARSVDFSGNSMNAAALLNVLQDIYTNRSSFTFPNPTLDITGGNMGEITLVASVPGDGVSNSDWTWDAGTSSHIPQTAGAYIYALENDPNLDGFSTWTISAVYEAIVASFTYVDTLGTVQFTDTSTGGPTSWSWNFGDTNTSTLQNPSHTYAATGAYTVTLTASNATSSDNTSQNVPVVVYELKVEFTTDQSPIVSPYAGEVGSVTITDTGNNVSVSGGSASWSTVVGIRDPMINTSTHTRAQGLVYKAKHTLSAISGRTITGILDVSNLLFLLDTQSLALYSDGSSINGALETAITGTNEFAFVLQTTGAYGFRKVSDNWRLIWYSVAFSTDAFYRIYSVNTNGQRDTDYMRVWQLATAPFTTLDALAQLDQSTPSSGTDYTGTADMLADMVFTQDGSPTAGEKIQLIYRKSDANNYWVAYLERNGGNTDWDFKLDSVASGTPTNRVTATSVGTVTRIRVLTVGTSHKVFTYGTTWSIRGTVTVSHNDAQTTINATYDAGNTVSRLISFARESANYAELDNG